MRLFGIVSSFRASKTLPAQFSKGGAALISRKNFEAFALPSLTFGRPPGDADPKGAQFVVPSPDLIEAIRECKGSAAALERRLSVGAGSLGPDDEILFVHIPAPGEHSLRKALADTPGATKAFVPGGKTGGGLTEAIVDQTRFDGPIIMPSDQEGLAAYDDLTVLSTTQLLEQSWILEKISLSFQKSVPEEH